MKNRIVKTLISVTLGLGLVAGGATSSLAAEIEAMETKEKNLYVIAFRKELPNNFEEIIGKAGGKVVNVLPEVGGIQAQSDDPAFLRNLKKVSSIEVASKEIPLALKTNQQPFQI